MTQYYEPIFGFSACACMGPVYGEPFCACTMARMGIPMSEQHVIEYEAAKVRFSKIDWSKFCDNKKDRP
jgi:hypothetical protein